MVEVPSIRNIFLPSHSLLFILTLLSSRKLPPAVLDISIKEGTCRSGTSSWRRAKMLPFYLAVSVVDRSILCANWEESKKSGQESEYQN